jgi:hypothetical protein
MAALVTLVSSITKSFASHLKRPFLVHLAMVRLRDCNSPHANGLGPENEMRLDKPMIEFMEVSGC